MKYRKILIIAMILFAVVFGNGVTDIEDTMYDLRLEVNLNARLPAGGEKRYHLFVPLGKDAMEYAVIQYPEEFSIAEALSWKPVDDVVQERIDHISDTLDWYTLYNKLDPVPDAYELPDDIMYVSINDFNSLIEPYALFLYSPRDPSLVYVLIHLT